jgi:hypothetical protein
MNRITKLQDNDFYTLVNKEDKFKVRTEINLVQIVGKLEDLLEKYGVESIEELEKLINKEK